MTRPSFKGFKNQALPDAPFVQAADEKTLVLRYSISMGYIHFHALDGRESNPLEVLTVLLNICLEFLGIVAGENSMLVGQKKKEEEHGEKEKNDSGR